MEKLTKALRDFEEAHAKYMSLSVFSEEGKAAKVDMNKKKEIYIQAYKEKNPDSIVF